MSEDYSHEKVSDGFNIIHNGKVVVHLTGEEGSLKAEWTKLANIESSKQECFDKCFANSDGSIGASKKCAKKCGLE